MFNNSNLKIYLFILKRLQILFQITMFCLVAVASARPQLYNDYSYETTGPQSYSDITDENDPRFMFDVSTSRKTLQKCIILIIFGIKI